LINAYADYMQWRACDAGCHWHDLIGSRLRERPNVEVAIEEEGARARKKRHELEIAREVAEMSRDERLKVWHAKTGKSEPALYRRLRELAQADSHIFQQSEK